MVPIIQLENISAAYGQKMVLQDVSLTMYDHDFLGIIGPNGDGKITPIQSIIGLKRPSEGQIEFYRNGTLAGHISVDSPPQYNDIDKKFPISAQEVVLSGLSGQKRLFSRLTSKHHHMVDETLARAQLIELYRRTIGILSGGQLQRMLLARAIVTWPEVLILDEPNAYIDRQFRGQMYQVLNDISRDCAIIIVSHDIGSILQNVKTVARVNHNVYYRPGTEPSMAELEQHLSCPIDLLGHGCASHHVLKAHTDQT